MNGNYCYSKDGEHYFGAFDTEEEALEDAKGSYPNDKSIYIGTCTEPKLRWNSNEEYVIESMMECLDEEVGEAAENFEVSTEEELELARMINAAVEAWILQEEIKPSCYKVLDGHVVVLN
jgi:hypothetical protein